jgi:hypothetical protein
VKTNANGTTTRPAAWIATDSARSPSLNPPLPVSPPALTGSASASKRSRAITLARSAASRSTAVANALRGTGQRPRADSVASSIINSAVSPPGATGPRRRKRQSSVAVSSARGNGVSRAAT